VADHLVLVAYRLVRLAVFVVLEPVAARILAARTRLDIEIVRRALPSLVDE
jgi:hypothetical protein